MCCKACLQPPDEAPEGALTASKVSFKQLGKGGGREGMEKTFCSGGRKNRSGKGVEQ